MHTHRGLRLIAEIGYTSSFSVIWLVTALFSPLRRGDKKKLSVCPSTWLLKEIQKLATELSCQRSRRSTFSSYSELSKVANYNLPHLHLALPLRDAGDPVEFCRDLRYRVPGLSCGVVCTTMTYRVNMASRSKNGTICGHVSIKSLNTFYTICKIR